MDKNLTVTDTLIVKNWFDPQEILWARYGQTQYLHLHKKPEKLKPTLIEARYITGMWLINSRTTKVGRERSLTILDKKMIKITGRLKAWETRRRQTLITSRMWTWRGEASNNWRKTSTRDIRRNWYFYLHRHIEVQTGIRTSKGGY